MHCRPVMGIDCIASSKRGINLTKTESKGLTDGEACVHKMCVQEKAEETFLGLLKESKDSN